MHRRTLLGSAGLGLTAFAGLGTWAYRAAPAFWNQYADDLKRGILPAPHRPDPKTWSDTGLHAAWLGHSTVLLKIDGTTILTDPVFSPRVGINLGIMTLGVKRLVEPALAIKQLPKIDLILLSHAHFDHFDTPTLNAFENSGTAGITASKTSDLLRVNRYRSVQELGWGERTRVGAVEVRGLEVKHWGARMRNDTYRGYNGYTIESGRFRVIFGGDTALTPAFRDLKTSRRYDLAIMPVGAYNPWIRVHCNPEESWTMANDAGTEFFLPIHHQTFALSREPRHEPIERLMTAAGRNTDRIVLQQIGQEFQL